MICSFRILSDYACPKKRHRLADSPQKDTLPSKPHLVQLTDWFSKQLITRADFRSFAHAGSPILDVFRLIICISAVIRTLLTTAPRRDVDIFTNADPRSPGRCPSLLHTSWNQKNDTYYARLRALTAAGGIRPGRSRRVLEITHRISKVRPVYGPPRSVGYRLIDIATSRSLVNEDDQKRSLMPILTRSKLRA
jgi:hypothetical protein